MLSGEELSTDYADYTDLKSKQQTAADTIKGPKPKTKDLNLWNLRNLWINFCHGISLSSFAICTACVLRFAVSLSSKRLECVLIVFSLTKSFSAISRLLMPSAI